MPDRFIILLVRLPVIRAAKSRLNKCHRDKGNSQQAVLEKGNGRRSAEIDNSRGYVMRISSRVKRKGRKTRFFSLGYKCHEVMD